MCCKGFFNRIVPFFLTFTVGLFIASFFVSIAAPNFRFPMRGERRRHFERDRMMEFENQRLNEENLRLRKQLQGVNKVNIKNLKYDYDLDVPPVPLMPPPPPVPMPYSGR
ncbi:MAG: hypothetical protein ABI686_13830 [Acidobacteriota bacterium]